MNSHSKIYRDTLAAGCVILEVHVSLGEFHVIDRLSVGRKLKSDHFIENLFEILDQKLFSERERLRARQPMSSMKKYDGQHLKHLPRRFR
jgi:hypothetical protein